MDKKLPWEIADLVIARLNDSITESESQKLDEWVAASDDHRQLYERWICAENIETFREESSQYSYLSKYEDLCHHIEADKRKKFIRRWRYVAAVITLPILFLCWKYLLIESNPIVVNEQITPGQYQALLTLPGGQEINLFQNKVTGELEQTSAALCGDTLIYPAEGVDSTKIQYHRLSVPRGGEYVLKLSDGTRVWLNSETELSYPSGFTGCERKVVLKGEAYFEVAHDSLHPFRVETGSQVLTVLGTTFSVRAYEAENSITTTLEQGRVMVCANAQQVELTPGYQSRLEKGKMTVEKVNTFLYTAWHKGLFVFIDEPLGNIMNTLSRWYNMEMFYTTPDLENICFTGELKRYENIEEFLDKLEVLEKVRFNIKGRTVVVSQY